MTISDEREADFVESPPIAAVGWIPYYGSLLDVPPCDFTRHPFSKGKFAMPSPFSALLRSGNPRNESAKDNPSPGRFESRDTFLELAKSRNFRGLIAIDELKVWYSAARHPTRLSFSWIARGGYTRLPMSLGDIQVSVFQPGIYSKDFEAELSDDGASLTVRWWLRFKIGRIGDLGCWVLTGLWAPSAIMMIECTVKDRARPKITFWGSQIPSVSAYVKWKQFHLHEMLSMGHSQIDDFLSAGPCRDAPVSELSSWEGDFEMGPPNY